MKQASDPTATRQDLPAASPRSRQSPQLAIPPGGLNNLPVRFTSQPTPSTHPTRHNPRPGKCILLVDDDATVRDSLEAVLLSEGYVVIPAENGQQALDIVARLPVDLALLDLNMPVKNGWDTFEELTREHPLIPIIIVTARPNQLFTAVSAGVGALMEKPMDIPTLLRTMKHLLAESADERLARLAGKESKFHYQPAPPTPSPSRPSKPA